MPTTARIITPSAQRPRSSCRSRLFCIHMGQFGIVEQVAKPGDRQEYFQLTQDPCVNILQGALARSKKARDTINKTADAWPKRGHAEVKVRLDDCEQFHQTVLEALNHAVERSS